MNKTNARRATSWSVIIGTLLVPLSAVAALVMVDPGDTAPTTTSSTTVAAQAPATTVVLAGNDDPEDLVTACGVEGQELVAMEESGTITEVQQAALDALREICAQEDMPLAGKPAPEPVVETVVVEASPPTTATAPAPTVVSSDDGSDDEYDDGYDDEYDDHEYDDEYDDHEYDDEDDEEDDDDADDHEYDDEYDDHEDDD